ncbi:TPA: immunoglobulin-binding protein, partial [Escherichia coli]
MLKRRDAFLKKSALAVSVALLLSAQAQAVLTGPVDGNSSSLLIGENSFITNLTGTVNNTFLLGGGAFNMDSPGSLQFGSFSEVYNSPHSVTLGRDTGQAESKYGVAIGKSAEVFNSQQSVAIGGWAGIENSSGSVALGHGSQVSGENNVVSVGAGPEGYGKSVKGAPETRRIINVSDGVKDSDAATKGQMDNAIADAVRESGDALRGEIGAVYRDAVADAKSRVESAENRLNGNITAARASAQEYTDAVKSDVLDETRTYTDSSVRTVRNEVKSQAEHLSDVLVKNRAQTDAAIASNTAAIRNNSHRLDLTEAWQKMATERMNNMQEQIKENRKELRESA